LQNPISFILDVRNASPVKLN